MAVINDLSVDLDLMELLHKRVIVEDVNLDSVSLLLVRPSKDEPANFQFVLDAFHPKKPKALKKKHLPITLDIDQVNARALHLRYNKTEAQMQDVLFEKLRGDIYRLVASGTEATWTSKSKRGPVANRAAIRRLMGRASDGQYNLTLSGFRFITDNNLPRKNVVRPKRGFFDTGHLDITADLRLHIFTLTKDTLIGEILECTASDSITGFDIRDLRTKVASNYKHIDIRDLNIQQHLTKIQIPEAQIQLPDTLNAKPLTYSTGEVTVRTVLKDISRPFAPPLKNFTIPLNVTLRMSGTRDAISFRNVRVHTDDRKLHISAYGDIKNLGKKRKHDVHFHVSQMSATSGTAARIINQFPIKKFMMKQLQKLGHIGYNGDLFVKWKQERFDGRVQTDAGPIRVQLFIDGINKYVSGDVKADAFKIGQVMDMPKLGDVTTGASFKIDISKPRTAEMRRQKGGKLPIGNVDAKIDEASYGGHHFRNLSVDIKSDGAIASGDIRKHGKRSDLYCSFSFTDTDDMRKMKIKHPGIEFHNKPVEKVKNFFKKLKYKKSHGTE